MTATTEKKLTYWMNTTLKGAATLIICLIGFISYRGVDAFNRLEDKVDEVGKVVGAHATLELKVNYIEKTLDEHKAKRGHDALIDEVGKISRSKKNQ